MLQIIKIPLNRFQKPQITKTLNPILKTTKFLTT
jgi:hypothetical protein